jgi:hypothetical protein
MKKLILIIVFTASISIINAQEIVSSAGQTNASGGYQVSWTLGEPLIETLTGTNNILTQGFHQTNLNVTMIDELKFPGLTLKVYPNPTNYILHIQSEGRTDVKLQFALFDANGKILLNKKATENPAEVNMIQYATGNYLLKITTTDEASVQQFKIIKK